MDSIPPNGGSRSAGTHAAQRRPRGFLIEHSVAIAAPAEVVWEFIAELEGWKRWNPLYIGARGPLEIGATITMTVAIPGSKPARFQSTIVGLAANEWLEYRAQALGGLLRGTRYVTIARSGPESCVVANGEIMGGLLGPLVARRAGDRVQLGLQLMSEALQKVAEARWQARSDHSTGMPGRPD
jgi:hypothetical protein